MKITNKLFLAPSEISLTFITSSGPGGQNVNKVASAAHLRFNVLNSPSLPEDVRQRLITQLGKKITTQGDIIIKADRFRTQERNKQDAMNRLAAMIKLAAYPPKKRKKTRPTKTSIEKRLAHKKEHSKKKISRQKMID